MQRYPVNLASSPGSTLRAMSQLQQRINRSTVFALITTLKCVEVNMRTDKNEDTVCILLPAIGHFIIFLLRHFHIHVENGFRPITKGGLGP
jgi:hypothetical protein